MTQTKLLIKIFSHVGVGARSYRFLLRTDNFNYRTFELQRVFRSYHSQDQTLQTSNFIYFKLYTIIIFLAIDKSNMADLNEKDRKFLVDTFTSLDVDGDGRVDLQELYNSKKLQNGSCKFYFISIFRRDLSGNEQNH